MWENEPKPPGFIHGDYDLVSTINLGTFLFFGLDLPRPAVFEIIHSQIKWATIQPC